MAKRQNKTARRAVNPGRALKQSHILHRKAQTTHAGAEALHRAAAAAHRKVDTLEKTARKRTGGTRVKDIPPPGRAEERVEAAKRVGAPSTDALEIIETHRSALPFSVVGIGASAGGFEAVVDLLAQLPNDLGMAVIIVQHLDPHHESRLPDLLAHKSPVPVSEIRNGMSVTANRIYVLPSNAAVVLEGT